MANEKNKFFTYKGLPLVRKGNQLYFGNMYDEFVVQMEILSTKKVGELEVADKVMIRKMSTDMTISPGCPVPAPAAQAFALRKGIKRVRFYKKK